MSDKASFWRCLVVRHDELEHEDKYNIGEISIGLIDLRSGVTFISFAEAENTDSVGLYLELKTDSGSICTTWTAVNKIRYSVNEELYCLTFFVGDRSEGISLVLGGSTDLRCCADYFERLQCFFERKG